MIICERLGCEFPTKTKYARFCSISCSSKTNAKRGPRKDYSRVCANAACGVVFLAVKGKSRNKYCSSSCSATINNQGVRRNFKDGQAIVVEKACAVCPNSYMSRQSSQRLTCSVACEKERKIQGWLLGTISANGKYCILGWARDYVLEQADYMCEGILPSGERCRENRKVPRTGNTCLDVDHIDGDWQNCVRENLRALCPTCHRCTDTYGAGNMGKGRTWKKEYNQYESKN